MKPAIERPVRGVIPALVTAVDEAGEFDATRQRILVERVLQQRAHALFVGGTTGEFSQLTIRERERLAELVLSEVCGQVPVVVHVAAPRLEDAIRLAQHAARSGARAIATIPPIYFPYRDDSVLDYLGEIANSTTLPFYYYHIPQLTGWSMSDAFFEQLLKLPNFTGVKFSEPDFAGMQELRQRAGDSVQFIGGVDPLLLSGLLLGTEGAIGSMYNFLLPLFVKVWDGFQAGDYAGALRAQEQANQIVAILNRYPGIAAVKETLRLLDLDLGPPRRPLPRLREEEKRELAEALGRVGFWDIPGVVRKR